MIESKGILNKFSSVELIPIKVFSSPSSERIEAESGDTLKVRVFVSNSRRVSAGKANNTSYSNGSAISMSANTNCPKYVSTTFKFTRTGFDLKMISDSYASISLDGVGIESITRSTPLTITKRNLENKEHTVVVTVSSSKKGSAVFDYLDVYN